MSEKQKILIIRLSSLGDVIFNIPLANVLKQNGYENSEDFKETMKKKIVLESEIDERKQELSEMYKEHGTNKVQASNTNGMSKGGK